MLINQTIVKCPDCHQPHSAVIEREGDRILGIFNCGSTTHRVILSEHADLFLRFRNEDQYGTEAPQDRSFYYHYFFITNHCNCQCPICFADASPKENPHHISMEEVEQTARKARKKGAKMIILMGGEPILHPHITEIIKTLRKHRLKVILETNGLAIADQPQLAATLKKAGLSKICLQLDTLNLDTHKLIRGHTHIDKKLNAARIITAASLKLGITATVSTENLTQIRTLCCEVLSWETPPSSIAFQGASHAGRFQASTNQQITREDILFALCGNNPLDVITPDHFSIILPVSLLDVYVHPDCGCIAPYVYDHEQWQSVYRYVDRIKLFKRMAHSGRMKNRTIRTLRLLLTALSAVKPAGWRLILQSLFRCSKRRILTLGAGAFMRQDFYDLQRISRCAGALIHSEKCLSMCAHFGSAVADGSPLNPADTEPVA
jgi:organic radical activating enzyme